MRLFNAVCLAAVAALPAAGVHAATVIASATAAMEATLTLQPQASGVSVAFDPFAAGTFAAVVSDIGAPTVSLLDEAPVTGTAGLTASATVASRTEVEAMPGSAWFGSETAVASLFVTLTNTTAVSQSVLVSIAATGGTVSSKSVNDGVTGAGALAAARLNEVLGVPPLQEVAPTATIELEAEVPALVSGPPGVFTDNLTDTGLANIGLDPGEARVYLFQVIASTTVLASGGAGPTPPPAPAPIPLPAGAPMLLAGLVAFALLRRR